MHRGSLLYLFLMKTATKKTNSVILNKEIKPLLNTFFINFFGSVSSLTRHVTPPPSPRARCEELLGSVQQDEGEQRTAEEQHALSDALSTVTQVPLAA